MHPLAIDTNPGAKPIRLFRSDFLEAFTHIRPVTIVAFWLPVAALFIAYAVKTAPSSHFPTFIPLAFLIGLFLWTLAEYGVHRFVFHHKPNGPRQERIFFLFHGIHHAQPQVKTRLVLPLALSIPMAAIFFGLFYVLFALLLKRGQWVPPLMSGFLVGYLTYDLTHYATHHFPMRSGYAKYVKRYHMQHHYTDPNTRFGVSSPIWDRVFETQGVD